jgi:hypothetical protein
MFVAENMRASCGLWYLPAHRGRWLRGSAPHLVEREAASSFHFRLLPAEHTFSPKAHFDKEEASRRRIVQESPEHRSAKELVAAELLRRLDAGLAMPWSFKDADASDYPLEGNLLLGADQVATEHPLETPFGCQFRLDVAVLGPPVQTEPMVLGGVEIELGTPSMGARR